MLPTPGHLMPDWLLVDSEGRAFHLWDYRQKCNVVLVVGAAGPDESRWKADQAGEQKRWDWLNAACLRIAGVPPGVEPGVYLVDRYGSYLGQFPLAVTPADIEREFVYNEARHC